jgi:hypothetical protein
LVSAPSDLATAAILIDVSVSECVPAEPDQHEPRRRAFTSKVQRFGQTSLCLCQPRERGFQRSTRHHQPPAKPDRR